MVLPEGLVLNSNERVYKIFRHVFIFDYLTVFGIEDIIYLLAFVIVDYRGSINHSIDILIIIFRSDSDDGKRINKTGHDKDHADSHHVA